MYSDRLHDRNTGEGEIVNLGALTERQRYWFMWEGYYHENEPDDPEEEGNDFCDENPSQWEHVDDVVYDYDLDKAYEEINSVFKRVSDGKLFATDWTRSYYWCDEGDVILREVVQTKKTITVYEWL